jgi:ADP-heptose:LPS heptosyltransferase
MFTTLRAHLVDHAFANLTDTGPTMLDKHDRDYLRLDVDKIDLSSFSLPSDYVVVTTGYTAKSREWPAKEINKVSSWVVKQGLTPVFLGSKIASVGYGNDIIGNFDNDVDHTVGVDLIGKTSLLEAGAILAKARAVVGVDNGLIHLAACSLVPIVVGFTNADKRTRLPIRRGKEGWMVRSIVPENLPCSGCQTKYHYLFEADFRECLFNDFECTKQMTGERFIAALEEFLQ